MTSNLYAGLAVASLWAMPCPLIAETVEKTVRNGDAVIAYSVRGEGPLMVLLPSVGRGAADFGPVAERLAERGYAVALPEPRGIGGSTGPLEGITLHDLGDDVARVIEAETGPAIIVGHAYGNWVARSAASDHPGLVTGVVSLAAGARNWPRELLDDIKVLNDPSSGREARLGALYSAFFLPENDAEPWLDGWHGEVTAAQLAAARATDRADWWHGGEGPILDLIAAGDPFRPQESRSETRDEFGDRVTVVVIEGASHALPEAKPRETADAIADWADRIAPR